MLACPRCGNDAEYLGDEVFSLLRCEFCARTSTPPTWCFTTPSTASPAGCCPRPGRSCCHPLKQSSSEPRSARAAAYGGAETVLIERKKG